MFLIMKYRQVYSKLNRHSSHASNAYIRLLFNDCNKADVSSGIHDHRNLPQQ